MRSQWFDAPFDENDELHSPPHNHKIIEQITEAFFPAGLPFSKTYLERALLQRIDNREQWIDPHGSFLATDITQLPTGGQCLTKTLSQSQKQLSLYLISDMGLESSQQNTVLSAIDQEISSCEDARERSLIIGNGDWAYPRGPEDSSLSEQQRLEETIFLKAKILAKKVPFLVALGNHEYGDHNGPSNPDIFLKMSRQHHLQAPGRYYLWQYEHPKWAIDYLITDTTTLPSDVAQQLWIQAQLRQSLDLEKTSQKPRWRILVAHHPFKSYGLHGHDTNYLTKLMGSDFSNIDLFLSGHEHDIQFFQRTSTEPALLICGTASHSRYVEMGEDTIFSSSEPGYAKLNFSDQGIEIVIKKAEHRQANSKASSDDTVLYQCHIQKNTV